MYEGCVSLYHELDWQVNDFDQGPGSSPRTLCTPSSTYNPLVIYKDGVPCTRDVKRCTNGPTNLVSVVDGPRTSVTVNVGNHVFLSSRLLSWNTLRWSLVGSVVLGCDRVTKYGSKTDIHCLGWGPSTGPI